MLQRHLNLNSKWLKWQGCECSLPSWEPFLWRCVAAGGLAWRRCVGISLSLSSTSLVSNTSQSICIIVTEEAEASTVAASTQISLVIQSVGNNSRDHCRHFPSSKKGVVTSTLLFSLIQYSFLQCILFCPITLLTQSKKINCTNNEPNASISIFLIFF